jgi:hypothetical protein
MQEGSTRSALSEDVRRTTPTSVEKRTATGRRGAWLGGVIPRIGKKSQQVFHIEFVYGTVVRHEVGIRTDARLA